MGAIFKMKFEYFSCFAHYDQEYGSEREKYSFMLNGKYRLGTFEPSADKPFSLIDRKSVVWERVSHQV